MKRLTVLLVSLAVGAAGAAEWRFPDKTDPARVIPHDEAYAFPDGFKATVEFVPDLASIGKRSGFANIFTKGDDFQDGYSLMVSREGRVLVDVKGVSPAYHIIPVVLESGRKCRMELYVTKTCVRFFLDGKECGSYSFVGTPDFSNRMPLRIGSMGGYKFAGSLPYLKLEPLSSVRVPPGGPRPMLTETPKDQKRAVVRWDRPICKEKDRYIGWPTVHRLGNGDVVAVFSGDREAHVCPWGKVQMVRSTDDGETWSAPQTVQNGPIDDRDAGLVQMPDGDLVLTWFTSDYYRSLLHEGETYDPSDSRFWWRRHDEKIAPETREAAIGYFRAVSKDNGKTWTKPMRMEGVGNAPHGPRLLKDGSLLQLGIGHKMRTVNGVQKDCTRLWVTRSTDKGATWQTLCEDVPWTGDEGLAVILLDEPDVIECDDGTLVGMVRFNEDPAHPDDHCLRQTVSRDGGRTWTPTVKIPVVGFPPHLLKLPDGKLVCVYGRRTVNPGYGEFAVISDDNGRTWDVENEIVLRPFSNDDLGYPSSCLLSNGDILTVYYQPEKVGEKPCLMATRWRVK